MSPAVRLRAALLLLASTVVILVGQIGRELLPPDDLREVEVAREMYVGGDYVVPHLAGLPFVEKPSGFPAVVATAYALLGGPTAASARGVSAAFALASLLAVFLLGRRMLGLEGAALATAILALSGRFCRTAHEVLLDNALTAAVAFTFLFAWMALEAEAPRAKRRAYAAAGFSLGVAFLFKGLVGPVLFGSGFVAYLAWSRRPGELRQVFRPLPLVAFVAPVLSWLLPFLACAPAHLVREFFVANHFGRFAEGYLSNARPWYFYFLDIWPAFAPASVLLPQAIWTAWKAPGEAADRSGRYLLAMALAPLLPLSLSSAKDSVYLLPVYPALATLVAWGVVRGWAHPGRTRPGLAFAAAAALILAAGAAVAATGFRGGGSTPVALGAALWLVAAAGCLHALRRGELRWVWTCAGVLAALMWGYWFTGPLAKAEVARRNIRGTIAQVVKRAGDRDLVLFGPSDGLRGATSFYRNRTARELTSPRTVVESLVEAPDSVAAVLYSGDGTTLPAGFDEAARALGAGLRVEAAFRMTRRFVVLVSAKPMDPPGQEAGAAARDSGHRGAGP